MAKRNYTQGKFDFEIIQEKEIIPVIQKGKVKLSSAQTTFNRLNKKIAKLKSEIEEIPERERIIKEFFDKHLLCLFEEEANYIESILLSFDKVYETAKLTKKEKTYLPALFLQESKYINDLPYDEKRWEVLDSLYNKYTQIHTGLTLEEIEQEQVNTLIDAYQEMGFKVTEKIKNAKNEEDFFKAILESQEADEFEAIINNEKEQKKQSSKKRVSTKNELEKELQENITNKSIREIYLRLAKKLHPDKEADEKQRADNEEKMKQLTKAYKEKDLASLLIMQVNWMEDQTNNPENLSDNILKQYNKILKEQIRCLEDEYYLLCDAPLPGVLGTYNGFRKFPVKELFYQLNKMYAIHKEELSNTEKRAIWAKTTKGVKQMLKQYIELEEVKNNGFVDFEYLMDLINRIDP